MSKLSPLSDSEKVFVEALAGAFGGLAGAVAFYPLDTIKTRIQAAVDVEGQRRKTWTEVFNDPALQAALAMSMREDQAAGAGAADPLADANYVNSILSSLPGVDPNDPSIQQALQGDADTKEDEGEEEK